MKQVQHKISSRMVLPLKVVSGCVITFCLFVGLRYIPQGISDNDYFKSGAGMILMLFPFFFLRPILALKYFKWKDGKIITVDLFNSSVHSFNEFISIKKLNFFMYELEHNSGKKICTICSPLNKRELANLEQVTGLKFSE